MVSGGIILPGSSVIYIATSAERSNLAKDTMQKKKLEVFSEDIPRAVLWYNCGTKWPRGVSLVLRILLSAWFAWCWCFVSGMGGWDKHSVGVSLQTPG